MATLEQQAAAIDAAQATLDAGKRALFRADGTRVYSDAEHAEREAALHLEYRQAIARVTAAANEAIAAAEATLAEGADDPLYTLSVSELDRANQLRPFIADDAAGLGLRALTEKVEGALQVGDKPALFCWQRALQGRLAALPTDRLGFPTDAKEGATLGTLIERLAERLIDPAAKAKRERARAAAEERQGEAIGVVAHAVGTSLIEELYGGRGR